MVPRDQKNFTDADFATDMVREDHYNAMDMEKGYYCLRLHPSTRDWFISKHPQFCHLHCRLTQLTNIEHIAHSVPNTTYVIELWELRNGEIVDEKKLKQKT